MIDGAHLKSIMVAKKDGEEQTSSSFSSQARISMNIVVIIAPSEQTSLPSFLLEQKCVSKTKRKKQSQENKHHLSVEISLCVGCLLLCCLLPGLVSASVSRWRWKIFVTKIVRVRDDGEEWRQSQ